MTTLSDSKPVSSSTAARAVLVLLLVVAAYLMVKLVRPFAAPFFIAAVLGGALHPTCDRLVRKLKVRRARPIAAGLITLAVLLVLVLPLGGITAWVVKMAVDAINFVRDVLRSDGLAGLVDYLPGVLHQWGERILLEIPRIQEQLTGLTSQGGAAAAAVGGALAATTNVVVDSVLMLIALYFLLLDGAKLVSWLNHALPWRKVHLSELLDEFRRVSVAVIVSSAATAAIQASAALVGLLIARVPNAFFFALLSFFLAFVPAVGAASVPVLMSVLLFLSGRQGAGVFLLVWAVVVVGLVDNLVKPLLIRGEVELHGAIVFFSLLGGLAVFGAVGLLAGPLIVVFFLSVVRIAKREFVD